MNADAKPIEELPRAPSAGEFQCFLWLVENPLPSVGKYEQFSNPNDETHFAFFVSGLSFSGTNNPARFPLTFEPDAEAGVEKIMFRFAPENDYRLTVAKFQAGWRTFKLYGAGYFLGHFLRTVATRRTLRIETFNAEAGEAVRLARTLARLGYRVRTEVHELSVVGREIRQAVQLTRAPANYEQSQAITADALNRLCRPVNRTPGLGEG